MTDVEHEVETLGQLPQVLRQADLLRKLVVAVVLAPLSPLPLILCLVGDCDTPPCQLAPLEFHST